MLRAAEADALRAELARLLGVAGRVGVRAHLQLAELVGPHHDAAELAGDRRVDGGDHAVVDVAGGAVEREPVALLEELAAEAEALALLVHRDLLAAGDAALAHAARDDGGVARHAAAHREDALGGLHALDVLRGRLQAHEDDLLAALLPRLGVDGGEDDAPAGGARRGGEAPAHRRRLLEGDRVELRVEERVEVARLDHEHGLLLGAHALVHEVAGDLQRGARRALAVAGLEHEELLVLDRELHVLHVAVVLLQRRADLLELLEDVGHHVGHLRDRHRRAHARDDVLALGVHEEFAHELLLARRRVAREGDARAGVVVEVAERHHLHVDGRAPRVGDVVVAAVDVRARVVPAAEDGLDGLDELLLRVVREVLAERVAVLGLELAGERLEVLRRQLHVELHALLLLHLVDELLEVLLADLHHDVGEHLDEAAVAVPRPARVLRLLREGVDDGLVEAEVEDRVHHARHRRARAGAHGDEERVLRVAELLAGGLLQLADVLLHLAHDVIADLPPVVVVARARLGRNREALRHRQPQVGHLREVRALAAEEVAHVGVAFRLARAEEIHVLGCFAHSRHSLPVT